MKCPSCGETIDDHSVYCAFCGEALTHKFCARCGGTLEKSSSQAKGLLILLFIVIATALLVLQVTNPKDGRISGASNQRAASSLPVVVRPLVQTYRTYASEETTFAGHTLYSFDLVIDSSLARPAIVLAARELSQGKLAADRAAIVDMRFFSGDADAKAGSPMRVHAVAVNMDVNPTFLLPEDASQEGENLYVEWFE